MNSIGDNSWRDSNRSSGCGGASRRHRQRSEIVPILRKPLRVLAVGLAAATLAACAQSSVVTNRQASIASIRPASPEPVRRASLPASRHLKLAARKRHTPFPKERQAAATPQDGNYGLASFYSHSDAKTASGEKFDPGELTAAHRSLPFGTRLRVTNVTTGKSVTVRVNDRGPFVRGRIVDVSHSAAESLGMVGAGVAKVKVDVVE